MVMLHEVGHYITAKRAGMKVTEFFLGFGPRLWSFQRGETEYGVKALPLGGYVRIIGMSNLEEVDPEDEPRTYRQGRYRDRLKVVLAGVTVNLLIAFLLFFVVIVGRGVADGPSTTIERGRRGQRRRAGRAAARRPHRRRRRAAGDELERPQARDRSERRPADSCSPSSATASRCSVDGDAPKRDGQGFLGVSPTTVVPQRRALLGGGARVVQLHGRAHHGHRRFARQALLAVGRRRVQQELHLRRAQGGIAGRSEPAAFARRASSTRAATSSATTCGRCSSCSATSA